MILKLLLLQTFWRSVIQNALTDQREFMTPIMETWEETVQSMICVPLLPNDKNKLESTWAEMVLRFQNSKLPIELKFEKNRVPNLNISSTKQEKTDGWIRCWSMTFKDGSMGFNCFWKDWMIATDVVCLWWSKIN